MLRTTDAAVAACALLAVWVAADLPAAVAAHWPEGEAWRVERRVKYIADGASHAALLALILLLAQRTLRGWPLLIVACGSLYGMVHGVMQAACGYAAYFTVRPAVRGPGGLCERTAGWEPFVLLLVAALILALLIVRLRRGA